MGWEYAVGTAIGVVGAMFAGYPVLQSFLKAREEKRRRLQIGAERLDAASILLTVTFRPASTHTRYGVTLTVLEPLDATLSEPGWKGRSGRGFVAMPSPAFDPEAVRTRTSSLDLTHYVPFGRNGDIGARIVIHAPAGLKTARLKIRIQDLATGAIILSLKETVTA